MFHFFLDFWIVQQADPPLHLHAIECLEGKLVTIEMSGSEKVRILTKDLSPPPPPRDNTGMAFFWCSFQNTCIFLWLAQTGIFVNLLLW